jgi:CBS domain containing-hemolysin-like protein
VTGLLWLAAFCLLAAMFFSAAEMAFIAANRVRLRHLAGEGHATATRYLEDFRRPERVLSTAMMGVTIAHIVAGSALTFALLPVLGGLAWVVTTAALTPVMLVLGEIIPKAVAREWATSLILRLYRPLTWASVALMPFVVLANTVVAAILRAVGGPRVDARQFEPGEVSVSTQEAEMIDKIFDLGDTTVREIMVPLVDVVMLPDTATAAEAIAAVRQRGFSRIPIYSQRETNVVGIVTAMDLLRRGGQVHGVIALMRQPTFVPQTKRIDDLLREMQKGRNQLAVVVDEFGGATGIVTLEDIVEQIVGEIRDEHDRTPASVERLPDGSFWVAARTHVDELNEVLDWSLPKQEYETVAGLVLATLHRIPRTGEEIQIPGYTITVLEADARRVKAVKIAPLAAPTPTAGNP